MRLFIAGMDKLAVILKRHHVRQLILILAALLSVDSIIAQCNCEKIKREDGTTVTQCPPSQVASDNNTEIGLSLSSNGSDKFIALTVRFAGTAQNVIGNLAIRTADNNLFTLTLINSGLSYIGNSQVTNAIFLLSGDNITLLKNSNIKTVSFTLADNLLHTCTLKMNTDIIKKQLSCL